jgi:hypothetical protein
MTGAAAGMRTAYGWPFVFLILAVGDQSALHQTMQVAASLPFW